MIALILNFKGWVLWQSKHKLCSSRRKLMHLWRLRTLHFCPQSSYKRFITGGSGHLQHPSWSSWKYLSEVTTNFSTLRKFHECLPPTKEKVVESDTRSELVGNKSAHFEALEVAHKQEPVQYFVGNLSGTLKIASDLQYFNSEHRNSKGILYKNKHLSPYHKWLFCLQLMMFKEELKRNSKSNLIFFKECYLQSAPWVRWTKSHFCILKCFSAQICLSQSFQPAI